MQKNELQTLQYSNSLVAIRPNTKQSPHIPLLLPQVTEIASRPALASEENLPEHEMSISACVTSTFLWAWFASSREIRTQHLQLQNSGTTQLVHPGHLWACLHYPYSIQRQTTNSKTLSSSVQVDRVKLEKHYLEDTNSSCIGPYPLTSGLTPVPSRELWFRSVEPWLVYLPHQHVPYSQQGLVPCAVVIFAVCGIYISP